jgi:eight-cysteine-cluster-containing protein
MRTLLALLLLACSAATPATPASAPATAPGTTRIPAVPPTSPHYAAFEGPSFRNDCGADADCKIGGCGGELCTAEADVVTACVGYTDQPRDATCGCVSGQCLWYRSR